MGQISARRGFTIISLLCVWGIVLLFFGLKSDASVSGLGNKRAVFSNNHLRVGYCETEPYFNYAATLHGLLEGLQEEGLIDVPLDELSFVEGQENSRAMWEWVADNNKAPGITFVKEAHYSLSFPDEKEALMENSESADLDLMIVMGTYAGQWLTRENHKTPMMVFSTSNAVQAGIVASPLVSGNDNVWAHVDLMRYQRQLRVFHELFHFERLGMVYDDSTEGLVYAAMEDVMLMAEELDFDVVSRVVRKPSNEVEGEVYHQSLAEAYKSLAGEVDAFYLTAGDWENDKLKSLLAPFYQHQVPVFSQMGGLEVQHGALMSLYRANYTGIGRFGARQISRFLEGETLAELPQSYGDSPSIVLNMAVAEASGYKPPFDILLIADEIYHEIK